MSFILIDEERGKKELTLRNYHSLRVVAGYANQLDLELAFLLESQSPDELPERVLGGVRVHRPILTPPWWDEVTLFG